MTMQPLTDDDMRRYARHLSLPGFGEEGQLRLKNGSVLVIGAGGLGLPSIWQPPASDASASPTATASTSPTSSDR